MTSPSPRDLIFIWILISGVLSVCTCLSCSGCKSLREGLTTHSTNEAKCIATRLYEKCLRDATDCEEKDSLLQEVSSVLQHMSFNNYICKTDEQTAHFGIIRAVIQDEEEEEEEEEESSLDKKSSGKSFTPSKTGLWIALGIWGGTFLVTAVGVAVACTRYRARQEKMKQQRRNDEALQGSSQPLPGYSSVTY